MLNPIAEEWRAQYRAKGHVITGPERPIIASRPFTNDGSPIGVENARRRSEFYRRLYGQAEARLEIWRFK